MSHRDQALATLNEVRQALQAHRPARPPRPVSAQLHPPTDTFGQLPEFEELRVKQAAADAAGIANPFYRLHDGRASVTTVIEGREVVNFSSYDYLGLNGHPKVSAAAKRAIDAYGTSVSASRLSAGERPVHRQLESALARLHGSDAALAFVSGHATNVTVIGSLLGPKDLIISDSVIHNSVMEGARLSGARRISVPHGDLEAVERALRLNRGRHPRTLVVVEGLYSMDGDVADLPGLVSLKERYEAWLMVDEAHSVGVLGASGCGIAEEQDVSAKRVDIWMGTLSKSFASAGGYIAGSHNLIEILKNTTPGFVYSVGLPAPVAAAALAAHDLMVAEPWRLDKLRKNGSHFLAAAKSRGLNVGTSIGASIIPVILGDSPTAVILSERLLARGFNVVPAIYPGVPENEARLRIFVTSEHRRDQLDGVLDAITEELSAIRRGVGFAKRVADP